MEPPGCNDNNLNKCQSLPPASPNRDATQTQNFNNMLPIAVPTPTPPPPPSTSLPIPMMDVDNPPSTVSNWDVVHEKTMEVLRTIQLKRRQSEIEMQRSHKEKEKERYQLKQKNNRNVSARMRKERVMESMSDGKNDKQRRKIIKRKRNLKANRIDPGLIIDTNMNKRNKNGKSKIKKVKKRKGKKRKLCENNDDIDDHERVNRKA